MQIWRGGSPGSRTVSTPGLAGGSSRGEEGGREEHAPATTPGEEYEGAGGKIKPFARRKRNVKFDPKSEFV